MCLFLFLPIMGWLNTIISLCLNLPNEGNLYISFLFISWLENGLYNLPPRAHFRTITFSPDNILGSIEHDEILKEANEVNRKKMISIENPEKKTFL